MLTAQKLQLLEMKIQLLNWRIADLKLQELTFESRRQENSFNLESSNVFQNLDSEKSFQIHFKLEIKDKNFDLSLHSIFNFEVIEGIITEEFKASNFPKINAPAIAFPYLRAFISNLTLQSGFEAVILPSINFVQLMENKE